MDIEEEIISPEEKKRGKLRFAVAMLILLGPVLLYFFANYVLQCSSTDRCKTLPYLYRTIITEKGDTLPESLPPFRLIDARGLPFTQDSLKGKIHIADFYFTTCPGMCVQLTKRMAELQEKVKDIPDVHLLSITVDPTTDSVKTIAQYAHKHKAIPGKWHFVTGNEDSIVSLIKNGYKEVVFKTPEGVEKVTHSARFFLVDKELKVRGIYEMIGQGQSTDEFKRLLEEISVLRCQYKKEQ
jgi:protein SCO1/2